VTIELTGGVPRTIHVEVDGRASVVDRLESPADVTLSLASGIFVRLAGGRVETSAVIDQIKLEGDSDLGMRVLSALPFTV
jgi:ubiquinone biosynthesis protein UbiJ